MLVNIREDEFITRVEGEMTHFPLCCSTGVLKNLQGNKPALYQRKFFTEDSFNGVREYLGEHCTVNIYRHSYLFHNIRTAANKILMPMPPWMAGVYAVSLMADKLENGTDDGGVGGYSGYKVGQFVWFDRVNADKRSGRAFNSYNDTFACDHLADFLAENDFGDVMTSPPAMGAHGARVRGTIFTPDSDKLAAFEKRWREKVVDEILEWCRMIDIGYKFSDQHTPERWQNSCDNPDIPDEDDEYDEEGPAW